MNVLSVQFQGHTFYVVENKGETWVPIKPICDALRLDWEMTKKWTTDQSIFDSRLMVFPSVGSVFETVCIPLRKFFGWLMSLTDRPVFVGLDDALYEGLNALKSQAITANGRLLLTLEKGRVIMSQAVPDDWLVAPLEGFYDLAAKAGYRVTCNSLHDLLYESKMF